MQAKLQKKRRTGAWKLNMGLKKHFSFFQCMDQLHCQHLEVQFRISLSNSEWIWVCTLCYKSGEVNYSVFSVHVNCVRWELGSRGHQPFCFIGHNKLKAKRKHWHCPFIVLCVLISLQLITLVNNTVPTASCMHGANRAVSVPNIRIFHGLWDTNSDQIIYLCFMTSVINTTKRAGSTIVSILGLKHCGSPISSNKKNGGKNKFNP